MGRTVLSLKELMWYLLGSKSDTPFLLAGKIGAHVSMARQSLKKRTVLNMMEHLYELVLEWI